MKPGRSILDPNFEIQDDLIDHARDALKKIALYWSQMDIEISERCRSERKWTSYEIVDSLVEFFDHIHTIERGYLQQLRAPKDNPSPNGVSDD